MIGKKKEHPPVPDWIEMVHYGPAGGDQRTAAISMEAWHIAVWLTAENSWLLKRAAGLA